MFDPVLSIPKILKALEFAAEMHKKQKRKGEEDIPYINHCIHVARLISDVGQIQDENLLIAAILHDTLEDTEAQPRDILTLFGKPVLDIVLEVSDDKSLPKAERKRLQIETAAKKSSNAKILKIADKISNIRDIIDHPPKDWSIKRRLEYLDWSAQVIDQIRGANDPLEALFDQYLQEGKNLLNSN
ncbi:MAG: HD domain-containing protein [Microscillaceae bacterium]|nr:HD domain-containing protein [Microscillaceae bacterium]